MESRYGYNSMNLFSQMGYPAMASMGGMPNMAGYGYGTGYTATGSGTQSGPNPLLQENNWNVEPAINPFFESGMGKDRTTSGPGVIGVVGAGGISGGMSRSQQPYEAMKVGRPSDDDSRDLFLAKDREKQRMAVNQPNSFVSGPDQAIVPFDIPNEQEVRMGMNIHMPQIQPNPCSYPHMPERRIQALQRAESLETVYSIVVSMTDRSPQFERSDLWKLCALNFWEMASMKNNNVHGVEDLGNGTFRINFISHKAKIAASKGLLQKEPYWLRSGHMAIRSDLANGPGSFDSPSNPQVNIGQLVVRTSDCACPFQPQEIWEIFAGRKDGKHFSLCTYRSHRIAGVTWRKDLRAFIINYTNQGDAEKAFLFFENLKSTWKRHSRPEARLFIERFKPAEYTRPRLKYSVWIGSSNSFPIESESQVLGRIKRYLAEGEQAPGIRIMDRSTRPYAFVNFTRFRSAKSAVECEQSAGVSINHAIRTPGRIVLTALQCLEEIAEDGITVDSKFEQLIEERLPDLYSILDKENGVGMDFKSFLRTFADQEGDFIQFLPDSQFTVKAKLLLPSSQVFTPPIQYQALSNLTSSDTWWDVLKKDTTVVVKLGHTDTFRFRIDTKFPKFTIQFTQLGNCFQPMAHPVKWNDGKWVSNKTDKFVHFQPPVPCHYGLFTLAIKISEDIPTSRNETYMNFVVEVSDIDIVKSSNAWIKQTYINSQSERLRKREEYSPPAGAFDFKEEELLMQYGGVDLYERFCDTRKDPCVARNFETHKQNLHTLLYEEESKYNSFMNMFNQTSSEENFFIQHKRNNLKGCDDTFDEWELKIDDPSKLSERRPSLSVGDKATAWSEVFDVHLSTFDPGSEFFDVQLSTFDGLEFVGIVCKIKKDSIVVRMPKKFSDADKLTKKIKLNAAWSVRFEMQENDRLRFRKYHHAIDLVLESKVFQGLSVSTHIGVPQIECLREREREREREPSLTGGTFKPNEQQKKVISTILHLSDHPASAKTPFLLSGPFGTGKTATLIETILQILWIKPDSRIYVCTETNSTADLYVEILHEIIGHNTNQGKDFSFHQHQMFRLMSPNRNREQCFQGTKEKELFFQKYTHEVSTSGVAMFGIPERSFLEKKKLIVGTWEASALLQYHGKRYDMPCRGFFTHIFVDEAAQMIEAAAFVPVCMAEESTVVVFAGDCQQIGPKILSEKARQWGLDLSIMARLENSAFSVHLEKNFRNHEDIVRMCSKLFYKNKISSDITSNMLENVSKPVFFYAVEGRDAQDPNSPSFFNNAEAEQIVEICSNILSDRYGQVQISKDDIQIISAFQEQTNKIRSMLRKRQMEDINVGPVDSLQGREKKVVLISSVRTSEKWLQRDWDLDEGFVFNNRRLNSAMSRASCLLVFVGHPRLLTDVSRKFESLLPKNEFPSLGESLTNISLRSRVWEQIVMFCRKEGTYIGSLSEEGTDRDTLRKADAEARAAEEAERKPLNLVRAPDQRVVVPRQRQKVDLWSSTGFCVTPVSAGSCPTTDMRMKYFCKGKILTWHGTHREYSIEFVECSICAKTEPQSSGDQGEQCYCEDFRGKTFYASFSESQISCDAVRKIFEPKGLILFVPEIEKKSHKALFVHHHVEYRNFQFSRFETWKNLKISNEFEIFGKLHSKEFYYPVYFNADWLKAAQNGDLHFRVSPRCSDVDGEAQSVCFDFLGCVVGKSNRPFLMAKCDDEGTSTTSRISMVVLPKINKKENNLEPLLLLHNFMHHRSSVVYLRTIFSVLQTELFFHIFRALDNALRSRKKLDSQKPREYEGSINATFLKLNICKLGDILLSFELQSYLSDYVDGQILAILCENQQKNNCKLFWVRVVKIDGNSERGKEKKIDVVLMENCHEVGVRTADEKEIISLLTNISEGWTLSFFSGQSGFGGKKEGENKIAECFNAHIHAMARIATIACLDNKARAVAEDKSVTHSSELSCSSEIPGIKEILTEAQSESGQPRSFHCWADTQLQNLYNKDQIESVKYAVDNTNTDVYRLIIGPPGTGKTQVGSLLMILFSQGTNILRRLSPPLQQPHHPRPRKENDPNWGLKAAKTPILVLSTNNNVVDQLLTSVTSNSAYSKILRRTQDRRYTTQKNDSDSDSDGRPIDFYDSDVDCDSDVDHEFEEECHQIDVGIMRIGAGSKLFKGAQLDGRLSEFRWRGTSFFNEHHNEVLSSSKPQDGSVPDVKRYRNKKANSIEQEIPASKVKILFTEDMNVSDLTQELRESNTRYKEKRDEKDNANIEKLKSATFIGATITGAAKYHNLISDIGIEYVIVDEAAMILEADLIAALPKSTKRVIMLGDHKQVSPNLEMSVWKPHLETVKIFPHSIMHDLNLSAGVEHMGSQISLFERLLLLGHAKVELTIQYRMPNVLANNIRKDKNEDRDWPLYSNCEYTDCDSPDEDISLRRQEFAKIWSVHEPGINQNKCFLKFIDHEFGTSPRHACADGYCAGGNDSKRIHTKRPPLEREMSYKSKDHVNESEARMVLSMVEWLIRNGVKPWSINILVMYRAQGDCIAALMKERVHKKNEKDWLNGYSDSLTPLLGNGDGPVRIFSVDSFQGGENDIILLSLSRTTSNLWVNDYRRVNVALSRARVALFVFGNLSSLTDDKGGLVRDDKGGLVRDDKGGLVRDDKSGNMWTRVLSEDNQYRISSFEVQCRDPRHHSQSSPATVHWDFKRAKHDGAALWSANELEQESYNGGCSKMMWYRGKLTEPVYCDADDASRPRYSPTRDTELFECSDCEGNSSWHVDIDKDFCRCGHEHEIPCHPLRFDTLLCQKQCTRFHVECGHFCIRSCSSPCGECSYPVKKYLSCGHLQNVPCHLLSKVDSCSKLFEELRNARERVTENERSLKSSVTQPKGLLQTKREKVTGNQKATASAFPAYLHTWTQDCTNCGISFVGGCVDKMTVVRCLRYDEEMDWGIPFLSARFLHSVENKILEPIFHKSNEEVKVLPRQKRYCLKLKTKSDLSPMESVQRFIKHLEIKFNESRKRHSFSLPVEIVQLDSKETYFEILAPVDGSDDYLDCTTFWEEIGSTILCNIEDCPEEREMPHRNFQRYQKLNAPQSNKFKENLKEGYDRIHTFFPYKSNTGHNLAKGGLSAWTYTWTSQKREEIWEGARYVDVDVPEPKIVFYMSPPDTISSIAASGSDERDCRNEIRVHQDILFIKSEFFMNLLDPYMKRGDMDHRVRISSNVLPETLYLLMLYIYSDPKLRSFEEHLRKNFEEHLRENSKNQIPIIVLIQLLGLSFCVGMFHLHDLCDSVLAEKCSRERIITDYLGRDKELNLESKWKVAHKVTDAEREAARKVTAAECCLFFPDNATDFAGKRFENFFDCMDFSFFAPKIRAVFTFLSQDHAQYLRSRKFILGKAIRAHKTSTQNVVEVTSREPYEVLLDLSEGKKTIIDCMNRCRITVQYKIPKSTWPKIKRIGVVFPKNGTRLEINCYEEQKIEDEGGEHRAPEVDSDHKRPKQKEDDKPSNGEVCQTLQLLITEEQAKKIQNSCLSEKRQTMEIEKFGLLEKRDWICPKCATYCFSYRDLCFNTKGGCSENRPPEVDSDHDSSFQLKWLQAVASKSIQKSIPINTTQDSTQSQIDILQISPHYFASGQSSTARIETRMCNPACQIPDHIHLYKKGPDHIHSYKKGEKRTIEVRPVALESLLDEQRKTYVRFFLKRREGGRADNRLVEELFCVEDCCGVSDTCVSSSRSVQVRSVSLNFDKGTVGLMVASESESDRGKVGEFEREREVFESRQFEFSTSQLQTNYLSLIAMLKRVSLNPQISGSLPLESILTFEFDLPDGLDGDWIVDFSNCNISQIQQRTLQFVTKPQITGVFFKANALECVDPTSSMQKDGRRLHAVLNINPKSGSWVTVLGSGFVQKKQHAFIKLLRLDDDGNDPTSKKTTHDDDYIMSTQLICSEKSICFRIPSRVEIIALKSQQVADWEEFKKLEDKEFNGSGKLKLRLYLDICGVLSNELELVLCYENQGEFFQDRPFMAIEEDRRWFPDHRLFSDIMLDLVFYLQHMYPHFIILDADQVLKELVIHYPSQVLKDLVQNQGLTFAFSLTPDSIISQNTIFVQQSGIIYHLLDPNDGAAWKRLSDDGQLAKAKKILYNLQRTILYGEEGGLTFLDFCHQICEDEEFATTLESRSVRSSVTEASTNSEYILFKGKNEEQKRNDQGDRFSKALRDKYTFKELDKNGTIIPMKNGVGGFGRVYRACDQTTGNPVVIKKIMRDQYDIEYETGCSREYRVLKTLQKHPTSFIVKALDLFQECACFVMEDLGNTNFKERLTDGILSENEVLGYFIDMLSGLQHMHNQGWVHQDLKPENIMIKDRKAVLVDLGLASSKTSTDFSQVHGGTLSYVSPEQVSSKDLTAKSDIYTFGLIALFCHKNIFQSKWISNDYQPEIRTQFVQYLLKVHAVWNNFKNRGAGQQSDFSVKTLKSILTASKWSAKVFIENLVLEKKLDSTFMRGWNRKIESANLPVRTSHEPGGLDVPPSFEFYERELRRLQGNDVFAELFHEYGNARNIADKQQETDHFKEKIRQIQESLKKILQKALLKADQENGSALKQLNSDKEVKVHFSIPSIQEIRKCLEFESHHRPSASELCKKFNNLIREGISRSNKCSEIGHGNLREHVTESISAGDHPPDESWTGVNILKDEGGDTVDSRTGAGILKDDGGDTVDSVWDGGAGDASFFLASASVLADKEGKAASEKAAADAKAAEGNAAAQKAAPVKAKVEEAVEAEKAKVEEALEGGTGSVIRRETKKAVRSARQEPTEASPEPTLALQQMNSGSVGADANLAPQQQKLLDTGKSKALRAEPPSEGTVKAAEEPPTKAAAEPAAATANNAAPSNVKPTQKLGPVDLRAKYEIFLKISVLLVVGACVLAFCFSPNEGCVYTRCTADVSYVGPSSSLLSLGGMFGSESEHVQLLGTFNSLRECEYACVVMKGRAKRALFWGASVVKKAKCVAFTYATVSTTSAAFNGHCYATVSYGNETSISSEPFLRPEYTGASNAVVSGLVTSLTPLAVLFRGAPQDTSASTDL